MFEQNVLNLKVLCTFMPDSENDSEVIVEELILLISDLMRHKSGYVNHIDISKQSGDFKHK